MPRPAETPTRDPLRFVLAHAETAGARVSRDQLERWQQEGLIPAPRRHGRGRGRGWTEGTYPPGTADQVVALARFLAEDRNRDRAALRLHGAGYPVRDDRLRAAYLHQLDRMLDYTRRWLADLASEHADDPKAAQTLARLDRSPTVRSWRRRVGERNGPGPVLRSVITNFCAVLAEGEAPDDHDGLLGETSPRQELTTALNAPAPFDELSAAETSLPRQKRLVKRASSSDLAFAVDAVRTLATCGELLRRYGVETGSPFEIPPELKLLVHSDDYLGIAWSSLTFLGGMRHRGRSEWRKDIAQYQAALPRLQAQVAMLEAFDPAERQYFRVDGAGVLVQPIPNPIDEKARRWMAERSDDAALEDDATDLITQPT